MTAAAGRPVFVTAIATACPGATAELKTLALDLTGPTGPNRAAGTTPCTTAPNTPSGC